MNQILELLLFLIPTYIANSSPVVLGGGTALDFGMILPDGERAFGNGKTTRGFIGGVLAGTVAGGAVAYFYLLPFFSTPTIQFIAGFAMAFGTLTGDALGSFIKRRLKVDSGKPFVLDTILFLIVALVFVLPFSNSQLYEPFTILFFLILTLILHPLTNFMANKAGLKKVPW